MDQFREQERFEMLVLETLNSARLLNPLIFGGGTMLRLCHNLDRYSVDLDFYLREHAKESQPADLLTQLAAVLGKRFKITDQADKFHSLLIELAAQQFPRRLKLEINKQRTIRSMSECIAWTPFSNFQVLLNTVDLSEMAMLKCEALLDRKEIRDAYDLEFLLRQGIEIPGTRTNFQKMVNILHHFTNQDFKVKLGSILEPDKRRYYEKQRFQLLGSYLRERVRE